MHPWSSSLCSVSGIRILTFPQVNMGQGQLPVPFPGGLKSWKLHKGAILRCQALQCNLFQCVSKKAPMQWKYTICTIYSFARLSGKSSANFKIRTIVSMLCYPLQGLPVLTSQQACSVSKHIQASPRGRSTSWLQVVHYCPTSLCKLLMKIKAGAD